jgi:putative hemolysin
MDTDDLWKLILFVVCLVFSAFFSSSETAFIALPRARLMHLLSIGKPGARRVSQLVQRREKLLATVLLGNNLVNTGAAALATAVAISLMDSSGYAVLVATVATTAILLVLGETLPKTVAWSRPEGVAFAVSRPLTVVGWVLLPPIQVLRGVSYLFSKPLGINLSQVQVTEDEIRTMISMGAEAGAVESTEAEMLEKVFHFGDRQVQEVMTPRTEIVWVEKDATLQQFLNIYSQETHTRFPVYEGDMENVVGILLVKDVLQSVAQDRLGADDTIADVLRPAYFVPETKLVGALFSELRQQGQQMAVIVDQHGGVSGLVTIKRLLEVIVGPVGEEGEPAREAFVAIGENVYDVDASMGIQEANDELGLDLPEGNYQTLAGFVLEQLGRIPQQGDHLYFKDLYLEVTEMKTRKIERMQIRRVEQTAGTA